MPPPYNGQWRLMMVGGPFDGLTFTHPGPLLVPAGWTCEVIFGATKQRYIVSVQNNTTHTLEMRPQ